MSRKPYGIITSSGQFVSKSVLDEYAVKSESRQDAISEISGQLMSPKYDPAVLAGASELNTMHARACMVKAQDVAGHGWKLTKDTDDADPADKERLEEFFRSLAVPEGGRVDLREAPITTIVKRAQLDYESVGYAAIEVVRENHDPDRPPVELVHIAAPNVRVAKDRQRLVQIRGSRRVWFKAFGADIDVDYKTGAKRDKGRIPDNRRASELLFWQHYSSSAAAKSTSAEVYGLPEHIPALGAIHGDRARMAFNLAFFDNFGVPAYVVTVTGDFDPGEQDPDTGRNDVEEIIWQHSKQLRDNPHSNLVLTIPTREGADDGEIEVEFEALAVDVKEASFRLFRKDNNAEVLNAHGVPAARVGVFEAGAANRESTEVYKRSVIDDRQLEVEQQINLVIHRGFGITGWRFELTELDNRDESHELDILIKLHAIGAVHESEIRALYLDRFGLDKELDAPGPPKQRANGDGPAGDDVVGEVSDVLSSLRADLAEMAAGNGHR